MRQLVLEAKLLTEEELDIILAPVAMTEPGISGIEEMTKRGAKLV